MHPRAQPAPWPGDLPLPRVWKDSPSPVRPQPSLPPLRMSESGMEGEPDIGPARDFLASVRVDSVQLEVAEGSWAHSRPGVITVSPRLLSLPGHVVNAVLAHEVAHVLRRDPQRSRAATAVAALVSLASACLCILALEAGTTPAITGLVVVTASAVTCASWMCRAWYLRHLELAADERGARILCSSGVTAHDAVSHMSEALLLAPRASRMTVSRRLLSSHPSTLKRRLRLSTALAESSL